MSNTVRLEDFSGALSYAPPTECLLGPIRMTLLDAAIELKIADHLDESDDPDVLAARLSVHLQNLRFFLDGLAAMGLVEKKDGRYANTRLAQEYLRTTSDTYLGELLTDLGKMQSCELPQLMALLRDGPPEKADESRQFDEAHWRRSARNLARYQRAGLARMAAEIAASLPEFPAMRRVLDLGGGPGVVCMEIVASKPELEGVICDQPAVIEVAREEIESRGLTGRVTCCAGNYNEIDFGSSYDLIWASHNLYFAKGLQDFIGRLLQGLNPGGVFISAHEGLRNERTGPAQCVLARLPCALEGRNVSFAEGEVADAAKAAGFAGHEKRVVVSPFGEIHVDILRKPGRLAA